MKALSEQDFKQMPWKNGGGTTTELFRLDRNNEQILRLSKASVSHSGPFSHFTETDRFLTLLEGRGFELSIDGTFLKLEQAYQWIHFKGEANVECNLIENECLDFNVMVKRGSCTLTVQTLNRNDLFFSQLSAASTLVYNHQSKKLFIFDPGEALNQLPFSNGPLIVVSFQELN